MKGELIAKSEDDLLNKLQTDAKLRKKLIELLNVNTPSKFRKQLESLTTNLYPVKAKKVKEIEEDEES